MLKDNFLQKAVSSHEIAEKKTKEAQDAIESVKTLLLSKVISENISLDFETLKDIGDFDLAMPVKKEYPPPPQLIDIPREPQISDFNYRLSSPLLNICYCLLFRRKINERNHKDFDAAHHLWSMQNTHVAIQNLQLINEYEQKKKQIDSQYAEELQSWEGSKNFHYFLAEKKEKEVEFFKSEYYSHTENGIRQYIETILSLSKYPELFPKEFNIYYNSLNRLSLIEYRC